MPEDYTPSDIPLYEDQATRDEGYRTAECEQRPYLAIECYEDGYAVTYDLFPAKQQLAAPAHKELRERVTRAVEDVVGDEALPTVEVSKSISASLGNVGVFYRERTAREIAVVIATLVLEKDNWVADSMVGSPDDDALRRN